MFCAECGKEISEGLKFCPNCGRQVTKASGYDMQAHSPMQTVPYNTMSIVGMVVSCISILINFWGLVGMAGLVLSIIGLQQVKQRHENGKGLAVAGIIIGSISIIYACLVLMYASTKIM